jgi:isopenicillin N synthase-like dioxygenase
VFATIGFAYLVDVPLSFNHDEFFDLAREFFALPINEKIRLAKNYFRSTKLNAYTGYFLTQPRLALDNLE